MPAATAHFTLSRNVEVGLSDSAALNNLPRFESYDAPD